LTQKAWLLPPEPDTLKRAKLFPAPDSCCCQILRNLPFVGSQVQRGACLYSGAGKQKNLLICIHHEFVTGIFS
jgi:hypothetical protein